MCLRLENGGSDCDDEIPQKLSDCYASGNTYLDSLPKVSSRQVSQLERSGQKLRFTKCNYNVSEIRKILPNFKVVLIFSNGW